MAGTVAAEAVAAETVSREEDEALEALREAIAESPETLPGRKWLTEDATDVTYLRFLRGHKLVVDKAFKLIKQCAKWRESYGTNTILETFPKNKSKEVQLLRRFWPMAVTGKDYAGRPVHFFHLSMVDFPNLLNHVPVETIVRYNVYLLERALRDNPKGEAVMLVDLGSHNHKTAFSLRTVSRWLQSMRVFIKAMAKIADPFYPESYFRIYFCRLHTVLEKLFRTVSSNMAEGTLSKVQLLKKTELDKLLEDIPVECLPPSLGGTSAVRMVAGGNITSSDVQIAAEKAAELQAADAAAGAQAAPEAAPEAAPAAEPAPAAEKRLSKRESLRKSLSRLVSAVSPVSDK